MHGIGKLLRGIGSLVRAIVHWEGTLIVLGVLVLLVVLIAAFDRIRNASGPAAEVPAEEPSRGET